MKDIFEDKIIGQALTFDDVLAVSAYSEFLPKDAILKTRLTKNINLNIPILAAAMDTVSESQMGIGLGLLGGAAVIHKNLSINDQVSEVSKVKTFEVDTSVYHSANLDNNNQIIVGAAVSTSDDVLERVNALVGVGVDFIVLDSAHGHSFKVIQTLKAIKSAFPELDIIAGNIATSEAAKALYEAGADCVKVGIGPGSICTTRVVAGVGVPQIFAIGDVYSFCKSVDLPLIADGGIKYSGDIVKALGFGADCVMLGSLFAGTTEAPGNIITIQDKQYKSYVGMGSVIAMSRGSGDRYFQGGTNDNKKLVPEGIESLVEFKGEVANIIYQLLGGLRAGMGYTGCRTIIDLHKKAKFVQITSAGLIESHPHDVQMIKEAPNYK